MKAVITSGRLKLTVTADTFEELQEAIANIEHLLNKGE